MSTKPPILKPRQVEIILALVTVFSFFSLAGWLYESVPNLKNSLETFILDMLLLSIPNTGLYAPGPANPGAHVVVYTAAAQFCLIFSIYVVAVFILRFVLHSAPWKKVDTFTDFLVWFGASYLISTFLNGAATVVSWFAFWSALLMLIGGSLILRAVMFKAVR